MWSSATGSAQTGSADALVLPPPFCSPTAAPGPRHEESRGFWTPAWAACAGRRAIAGLAHFCLHPRDASPARPSGATRQAGGVSVSAARSRTGLDRAGEKRERVGDNPCWELCLDGLHRPAWWASSGAVPAPDVCGGGCGGWTSCGGTLPVPWRWEVRACRPEARDELVAEIALVRECRSSVRAVPGRAGGLPAGRLAVARCEEVVRPAAGLDCACAVGGAVRGDRVGLRAVCEAYKRPSAPCRHASGHRGGGSGGPRRRVCVWVLISAQVWAACISANAPPSSAYFAYGGRVGGLYRSARRNGPPSNSRFRAVPPADRASDRP